MEQTAISWCDSTFNPWVGCSKVSPACDHCYAERLMDHRMHKVQWGAGQQRVRTSAANWRQPLAWEKRAFVACPACDWRGDHTALRHEYGAHFCPKCGNDEWRPERRRVFCASLADVFDNEVDPAWRVDLLMLIRATPALDWLVLTKRVGNVLPMLQSAADLLREQDRLDGWDWLNDWVSGSPPRNAWLGATVVTQEEADRDIPKLLAVPAAKRFLSIEPMLGPIDLTDITLRRGTGDEEHFDALCFDGDAHDEPDLGTATLDWVICGGESGPHARPINSDWVRSLRDQCEAAGVPFHWKQWGEWVDASNRAFGTVKGETRHINSAGQFLDPPPEDENADCLTVVRVGTKASGRLLDGIEHNGVPA